MRDEMTKQELEDLYHKHTNMDLCEILNVSQPTLLKMLDEAGIEKKGKGYAQKYLIV